jgi:hypothetical protein
MEKGADADGTIPMKTVMKKMLEWYVCQLSALIYCFQRNILKLLDSVLLQLVMRSPWKCYLGNLSLILANTLHTCYSVPQVCHQQQEALMA